jgi:cardiolipin synthase
MTGNKAEGLRIQPYDDSPLDNLPIAETVYLDIIDCAKDYVWIFTPYLVLDDKMRETLCKASMRGVHVRIVTPGIPDKKTAYRLTRSNYEVLLSAGVKIYEYSPGFIHAKSILADDTRAVVGTVNFDYRSFYHHFENAVYFSGCDAVLDLKRDCEETFAVSKQRTKENYKRSAIGKLFDGILRAFETLF